MHHHFGELHHHRDSQYESDGAQVFQPQRDQQVMVGQIGTDRRQGQHEGCLLYTSSALRALYLYRIRELAHCMWSAGTEQHDRSMDYWLAAEKHLRLLTESAARSASVGLGREDSLVKAFETFSAANHLEQIRKTAYQLWEATGRPVSYTHLDVYKRQMH